MMMENDVGVHFHSYIPFFRAHSHLRYHANDSNNVLYLLFQVQKFTACISPKYLTIKNANKNI